MNQIENIDQIVYETILEQLTSIDEDKVNDNIMNNCEYIIPLSCCKYLSTNNEEKIQVNLSYEIDKEYDDYDEDSFEYKFQIFLKTRKLFVCNFKFDDNEFLEKLTRTIISIYKFYYTNYNSDNLCSECDIIMVSEEDTEIKNEIDHNKRCKYFSNVCNFCWKNSILSREYTKHLDKFQGEECMICYIKLEDMKKENKYINLIELKCCKGKTICGKCIKKMNKCNDCGGSRDKICCFCKQHIKYNNGLV